MDNKDELEFKQTLLDILKVFHCACEKLQINYSLAYGTLLGAVRHQDFIPWDDDIDVMLMRKDFEQLPNLFPKVLPEGYEYESIGNNSDFPYMFGKLYNTNTSLVEVVGGSEFKRGVYIDVFPLDYFGNSFISRLGNYLYSKIKYSQFCLAREKKFDSHFSFSFIKNRFYSYPGVFYSMEKISRQIIQHFSRKPTVYIANPYGIGRISSSFKVACFENRVLLPFHGEYFYCVSDFDSVLSGEYGDYHLLPPLEQRTGHINHFKLDLQDSYKKVE